LEKGGRRFNTGWSINWFKFGVLKPRREKRGFGSCCTDWDLIVGAD